MSTALTFQKPEQFEQSLLRVSLGAAAGGLVAGLATLFGIAVPAVWALPLAGGLAALGHPRSAPVLAAFGLVAGILATLPTSRPLFYLGLAGVVSGLGLALSRYFQGRDKAPSVWAWVGTAVAGAVCLGVGTQTVEVFDSHGWFNDALPLPLAYAAKGLIGGFFLALAAAPMHLAPGMDEVEKLYAQVERELGGELARLCGQSVALYRKCKDALAQQTQGAAQQQLKATLEGVTRRALELARRWYGVDVEMGERAESDVEKRLGEVRTLFERSSDPAAKRQLQAAEKALQDEVVQIRRIRAGRERVVARLHADLAILERTRFALLALRSSDAHLKAAELSTLSDNLSALGKELDVEAQAIDDALREATMPTTGSFAGLATSTPSPAETASTVVAAPLPVVPAVAEVATPTEGEKQPMRVEDIELTR
jgi:hypothetical protein